MIRIGNALLSEDVFEAHFACDLAACKGACCVEGDSGAPLTQAEVGQLEEAWPHVAPLLPEAGRKAVEEQGLSVRDADGDLVTPLVAARNARSPCSTPTAPPNAAWSAPTLRAKPNGASP